MSQVIAFFKEFEQLGMKYPAAGFASGVLLGIGLYKLISVTYSFTAMMGSLWVLPAVSFKKYGQKTGAWSLVTGATAGLGEEFAYQLAAKGFNILVLSRSREKLEAVQADIESKFKVETRNFVMDVAHASDSDYNALKEYVKDLKLTVLVNNVGLSHSIPVSFAETDTRELTDIIAINNMGTLRITQAVLPRIEEVAAQKNGPKGLIINISSFAGLIPTGQLAVYSGSKAFLQHWGIALGEELKAKNIDVDNVLSYLVTSKMSKIRRTSLLVPNPKQFVKSVLRSVGRRVGAQERVYTTTPYWSHAFVHWAVENTLGVFSSVVVAINYAMHQDIRRRALRKAERLAKQK